MDDVISKGMSATTAGKHILNMIEYQQKELVVGPLHHCWAIYLRTLFPSVYFIIMRMRAASEKHKK